MNELDEFDLACATARERQMMRRIIAAEKSVQAITLEYQNISAALAAYKRRLETIETALAWKEKERQG